MAVYLLGLIIEGIVIVALFLALLIKGRQVYDLQMLNIMRKEVINSYKSDEKATAIELIIMLEATDIVYGEDTTTDGKTGPITPPLLPKVCRPGLLLRKSLR